MDLPVAMMSVSAGWLVAGEAESPKPKVEQLRLDNGLTVLVRPVQGARRAALVVLYNIGGDMTPKGSRAWKDILGADRHAAVVVRPPQAKN